MFKLLIRAIVSSITSLLVVNQTLQYKAIVIEQTKTNDYRQEPITWSAQLPYIAGETAFLQVELFLDIKAFTEISSQ